MKTQNELNTLLASQIAQLASALQQDIGSKFVENIINNLDEEFDIIEKQHEHKLPIALLNTTIATTDGEYEIKTISTEEARQIFKVNNNVDSAIGHESTAAVMSTLLGWDVYVNRQQFEQKVGQTALVFKLKGRAPEGVILSESQIEEIGYEFKLMTRKS